MNYGIELNNKGKYKVSFKPHILERAGYKKVVNHFASHFQPDEQWISNTDNFGRARFPRFHLVKANGKKYLHRDYFEGNEHRTNIEMTSELKSEIKRLHYLTYTNLV
jgi:hypothetical protein